MSQNKKQKSLIGNFLQTQERRYEDDYLRTLNAKQLKMLGEYCKGAVDHLDAVMRKVVDVKGSPTAADKTAIMRLKSGTSRFKDAHYKPEEAVISTGGMVQYTPTEIVLTTATGETLTTLNAPVPSQFGARSERKYVQYILPLCAQLVTLVNGKWQIKIESAWSKVFMRSGLDLAELHDVSALVLLILQKDRVWKDMPEIARLATTGAAKLTFIKEALERIDELDYIYLHTAIVVKFFAAVIKDGNRFVLRMRGGSPAVPEKCYVKASIDPKNSKLFRAWTPSAYYYVGGFIPDYDIPVNNGDIGSAVTNLQRLREFSGGDKSAIMVLSGMRDFSGLTTESGQRLSFLLSASLYCWSLKKTVDIRLSTMGDLIPLISSFAIWKKRFPESYGENIPPGDPSTWVKFLTPTRKATQVDSSIASFIINAHRSDSVALWWSTDQLQTSAEKGKTVDHDWNSYSLLPADVVESQNDFIAFNPIYGPNMFPGDKAAKPGNRTNPFPDYSFDELFVYVFSNAAKFSGVVSTLPNLHLIGNEKGKTGNWSFQPVKLKLIPTAKEWYNTIIEHCSTHYSLIFNAVRRYSPITNLLYMSKKAVQLQSAKELLGDLYVDVDLGPLASVKGGEIKSSWDNDGNEVVTDEFSGSYESATESFEDDQENEESSSEEEQDTQEVAVPDVLDDDIYPEEEVPKKKKKPKTDKKMVAANIKKKKKKTPVQDDDEESLGGEEESYDDRKSEVKEKEQVQKGKAVPSNW